MPADVADPDNGLATRRRHPLPQARDRRLTGRRPWRLAPGGLLAITALSEVGATPGPFRVAAGELSAAFAGLDVIAAGEGQGEAWLLARARRAAAEH